MSGFAIKQLLLQLLASLLWNLGFVNGSDVTQNPLVWKKKGENSTIECDHTKGDLYFQMYWYRQLPGKTMELVVFTTTGGKNDFGSFSEEKYSATKTVAKSGTFTVKNLEPKDEALYFCAVSQETGDREAYFGQGTKLTVLEKDNPITPPTVKVFRPSDKECKDPISEKEKKKTIVCVASNFYPDHVSVSWEGNGKKIITKGVATDAVAKRDGKFYRISSRLTVPIGEWLKQVPYTCKVNFFNGTVISVHNDSTTSNTKDTDMTRENYLKITQNAKLSYGVLIVKSCVYAAFVCFLVWKLQEKRRKDAK